jgi:hypothetical protein
LDICQFLQKNFDSTPVHPPSDRLPRSFNMDMVDTGIGEDRVAELEVVEREPDGVVLVRHWTSDGAVNSSGVGGACETGCSKDQPTFATQNFSCSSP